VPFANDSDLDMGTPDNLVTALPQSAHFPQAPDCSFIMRDDLQVAK